MTTTTLPTTTKLAPKHARHLKYAAVTAQKKNIQLIERPKPVKVEQPLVDETSALYNDQNKKIKLEHLEPVQPVQFIIDTVGQHDNQPTPATAAAVVVVAGHVDGGGDEAAQPKRKKHKKSDKHRDRESVDTVAVKHEKTEPAATTPAAVSAEPVDHYAEHQQYDEQGDQSGYHIQRDTRPSRVPRETVDYYKNIQALLEKNEFDTPDERNLTINAALRELCAAGDIDQCYSLLIHPIISRTVEYLLKHSVLSQKQELMQKIETVFTDLVFHKNGCHVIETYMDCVVQERMMDIIVSMMKQCEAVHYLQFVTDTYATHPLRKLMQIASDHRTVNSDIEQHWTILVNELCAVSINEFNTYIDCSCAIPVYQLMLTLCNKSHDSTQESALQLVRKLMLQDNTNSDAKHAQLMSLMCGKISSRLLETILQLNNTDIHTAIFDTMMFKPKNLLFTMLNGIANFPMQQLLQRLSSAQQLDQVFEVCTADAIKRIVDQNKMSVMHALLLSCVAHKYQPDIIVERLCSALNVKPSELLMTVLQLQNNTVNLHKHKSKFNNVGCTIVQSLIKLVRKHSVGAAVISGILHTDNEMMVAMCNDNAASHCIDVLITQTDSGTHQKLLQQLTGRLVDLACNAHGSFVLEKLFDSVDVNGKLRLCTELLRYMTRMTGSRTGVHAVRGFKLELLKRDQPQWLKQQANKHKTKDMLSDIIGDDSELVQNDNNVQQHALEVVQSVQHGGDAVTSDDAPVDANLKQVLNVISRDNAKRSGHKKSKA